MTASLDPATAASPEPPRAPPPSPFTHPQLGAIKVVFRPRRWTPLVEVVVGVPLLAVGAWSVVRVDGPHISTPYNYAAVVLGLILVGEGVRRLLKRQGLVVAADGFEDHAGGSGSIAWASVVDVDVNRTGRRVELVVRVAQPDGRTRDSRVKVSEIYGSETAVLEALEASRAGWAERQGAAGP